MNIFNKTLLIFFLFLIVCNNNSNKKNMLDVESIKINKNWKFSEKNKNNWLAAKVPGCIHTDLLRNSIIENPFFRDNENKLKWISEKDWEYSCDFILPDEIFNKKNINIIFHGLDTYAQVYLNNNIILNADNMFRQWNINAKQYLKKGKNNLKIIFSSVSEKEKEFQLKSEIKFPGGQRSFTRKAAYHYGWDWAPELLGCGIWKPVEIIAWNKTKINNVFFSSEIKNKNTAVINAEYNISSDEKTKIELSIKNINNNTIVFNKEIILQKGENNFSVKFQINNPKLWQVHNIGEPYLYSFETIVKEKSKLLEKKINKIGIRKIELIRDKDEYGETFYFKLNDNPIFMKGANYVPQDVFLSRVLPEKYEKLIQTAVDENINMLRVWGGGIYENDIFYDLCDKYGILIWQDFMFANTLFPDTDNFIENIKSEAKENIIRLRNHPCIALWCGNNEIDEAWHNWGWHRNYSTADSIRLWENYKNIFHKILPDILKKYHKNIAYVSSSPTFGRGDKRSLYQGDSHYWGVWHDKKDFDTFFNNTPRFMSEFGFQALPDIKTINYFTNPEDKHFDSKVMLSHQKHRIGNKLIKEYLLKYYNWPQKFEHQVYLTQLLQAEGIKMGIEAHRRAKPYCMGSLYWQFNDCWPVSSWSSVDYFYRHKALHFFAKKAFKNLLISPIIKNNKLNIAVINDNLNSCSANLIIEVLNFNSKNLLSKSLKVKIDANSVKNFNYDISGFVKNKNKTLVYLKLIDNQNNILADNILYFNKPKNLILKKIKPDLKINKTEFGYELDLYSDYLLKNINIIIADYDVDLSDNYFDLLPENHKKIKIFTDKNIKNKIKIYSLADIYVD